MHIGFAVGQGGQRFEVDQLARHHEGRHILPEIEYNFFGGRGTHIEKVEGGFVFIVKRAAVCHACYLFGGLLDLAQLDAVAEVLDLAVFSAVEVQDAVFVKVAEVAGLVDQLAVVVVERIL